VQIASDGNGGAIKLSPKVAWGLIMFLVINVAGGTAAWVTMSMNVGELQRTQDKIASTQETLADLLAGHERRGQHSQQVEVNKRLDATDEDIKRRLDKGGL